MVRLPCPYFLADADGVSTSFKRQRFNRDSGREAKQGDTVKIVSSRPISRLKRWRLKEVLTPSAAPGK